MVCLCFQVHSHPQRRLHKPVALEIPTAYQGRSITHTLTRDKLELFAVLCIETSHYVSFIKYGPKNEDWIFFDSMADRQGELLLFVFYELSHCLYHSYKSSLVDYLLSSGDRNGFNIPEVHACPEVGMYLEMSPAELASQVPRDMKGVAKRLFCDAYMYLYQSTNMSLYRWGDRGKPLLIQEIIYSSFNFLLLDWSAVLLWVNGNTHEHVCAYISFTFLALVLGRWNNLWRYSFLTLVLYQLMLLAHLFCTNL